MKDLNASQIKIYSKKISKTDNQILLMIFLLMPARQAGKCLLILHCLCYHLDERPFSLISLILTGLI
jgi:hypothetical protein